MFLTFYEFGKLEASTPSACADRAPAMMGARRLLGAAGVVFVMEKRRNQQFVCCSSPNTKAPPSFSARLERDTATLRGQLPKQVLEDLELAKVFHKVQELVRLVDDLQCTHDLSLQVQSAKRDAVRLAYRDFTEALEALSVSVLGQGARPLATTRSWVPLLRRWRYYVCSLFSWGLLTEQAVAEAADVLKVLDVVGIIDPLAGSGWHALLWREVGGLSVLAMDSYAVRPVAWAPVAVLEDSRTAMRHLQPPDISRWALFLSWPPHSPDTVGSDLLEKFEGTYFLYLGEEEDPNAGDAGLTGGHQLLSRIEKEGSWMIAVTILAQLTPGLALDLTIEFVTR
eukprot:s294_g2.t5